MSLSLFHIIAFRWLTPVLVDCSQGVVVHSTTTSPAPTPFETVALHEPIVGTDGRCRNGPSISCQPLTGSIVFTTLFTKHIDATGPRGMDPYRYIEKWFNSLHAVGMRGLVVYDDLTNDFIASHSTHSVIFRKTASYLHRSPNDRRFYIYRDILRAEEHLSVCVFTDVRDVRFQHNVLQFITDETLRDTTRSALFVGLDVKRVGQHSWLRKCDNGTFTASPHGNSSLLNAGFLGCTRLVCLVFLDRIIHYLDAFVSRGNCNMLSFNRAAYDLVDNGSVRIVTGKPLVNRLFDNRRDDSMYVMHKGYEPLKNKNS